MKRAEGGMTCHLPVKRSYPLLLALAYGGAWATAAVFCFIKEWLKEGPSYLPPDWSGRGFACLLVIPLSGLIVMFIGGVIYALGDEK